MAISETIDAEFASMLLYLAWTAVCEEFSSPEEWVRIDKIKWLKGEAVFDELQKELKIPAESDPFTVAKAVGDYLTKIGYAKFKFIKVSDTEILYDRADMVPIPVVRRVRAMGMKVIAPEPSHATFVGALRRICNAQPEIIRAAPPEWLKSGEPVPDDMGREMWRVSPISKKPIRKEETY
ncbi:MAG: hypothetical protein HYY41_05565 [Chloroflexi bacterium]|nr:hypothetical protein [Chloroflexota bacterium]MBI2980272.1 hypothetical protein [Chloroflexota bacterium]